MRFEYATGESSFTKASTSPGLGGRPVRSNDARRISETRSARRDGVNPCCRYFKAMKRSIGLDAQPGNFDASCGIAGLFNCCKAHQVPAFAAERIKIFPNNSRKQPSPTYPRRQVDFIRLRKMFIFVGEIPSDSKEDNRQRRLSESIGLWAKREGI